MHFGFHHLQKQKSQRKFSSSWVKLLDKIVFVAAIFGPALTLPQVTKIWLEKNANGVSLITWLGYLGGAIFWTIYGLAHKEKPIILANLLLGILAVAIVLGVLLYS